MHIDMMKSYLSFVLMIAFASVLGRLWRWTTEWRFYRDGEGRDMAELLSGWVAGLSAWNAKPGSSDNWPSWCPSLG